MRCFMGIFLAMGAAALAAQEAILLTDKEKAQPTSGYTVSPPFATFETGVEPYAFAHGCLTDGDSSFDHRKSPTPYAYWQKEPFGDVQFDLGGRFRVERVRVCVLNSGPHGTARIELFAKGNPLEFPEALKISELDAENGWNVFEEVSRTVEGIRLRFHRMADATYITVSEVEIWGEEAPQSEPAETTNLSLDSPTRWRAFDFGPAESPVFANFSAVSKDTTYTPERGFGWIPYHEGKPISESNFTAPSKNVPGLHERDRAAGKSTCSDTLYRDLVMTSAYYHTQVRQMFVVDMPNGTYRVTGFHGDLAFGSPGRQAWWVEAEGARVIEHPVLPRSLTMETTFEVEVQDGQLTLVFDAEDPDPAKRGFMLNGLVVFPVNNEEEVHFAEDTLGRIRTLMEHQRKEYFEALFTENPYVEEAEMPPLSPEDEARGYVAFIPHWMTVVYPVTVPRAEDLKRPLGCFACPGEYEPMTVAVRALKTLSGTVCSLSDLTGPGVIPASAVEVRTVKCWPQRWGSSWSTEWRVVPELLEKARPMDIAVDTTQVFWLTVRVPDETAAGTYTGKVRLTARNAGTLELPISVEVLPFTLVDNEWPVGMYWYEVTGDDYSLRDAQIRDMIEHGMTTLTMGQLLPELHNDNGELRVNTEDIEQYLREIKAMGIEGPIPYLIANLMNLIKREFPDASEEKREAFYVEVIRRIQDVSARADTPQLLFYPIDEISRDDAKGKEAHDMCALIGKVPGAVSYVTVNNYAGGEKWGDTFDIWCGNIPYTKEQEERLLARGKRYMRYGSAYQYDARKARNSCGFGFYRFPAEAMYYWHYQSINGDAWNDLDGDARDWCAVYPGENGELVPTIDWEGLREGVDDMRYIATLKQYAALASKTPDGKDAAKAALNVLDDVLAGDPAATQYDFRSDLSDDAYHSLRRRLVDAILTLLPYAQSAQSFPETTQAVPAEPIFQGSLLAASGVFVTDIQVGSPRSFRYAPAWVENWKTARQQIIEFNPDLVLIGGDLTRDGWLDEHFFELEAIKTDLDRLPMPYYVTPGNMDVGNKHTDRQGAFDNRDDIANNMTSEQLQRFCSLFGPHCWSFVHKNLRFSAFTAMLPGSGLPEEAEFWAWMEAQRSQPRAEHHVWMSHYPLFIEAPDEPNWDLTKREEYHAWYFGIDQPHRGKILDILRDTGAELFVSGHIHCRKRHVVEGITFDLGPCATTSAATASTAPSSLCAPSRMPKATAPAAIRNPKTAITRSRGRSKSYRIILSD